MRSRGQVVLLPGFGGSAQQPVLVKLSRRLEQLGFSCQRAAPPRGRLTAALEREVAWLDEVLTGLRAGPKVLVGRSFGARVCARRAARGEVAACVLLGYPLRPPGKPRPLDEAALREVRCPTLLIQGSKDELGALALVRRTVAPNACIELKVLEGAGHGFGRAQGGALDEVASWLDARIP